MFVLARPSSSVFCTWPSERLHARRLIGIAVLLTGCARGTGGRSALQPLAPSSAGWPAAVGPRVSLEVEDRTPKFLAFYRAATIEPLSEPQRWLLWKRMYDFAAVPPGVGGDTIARRLLSDAWPRYPEVMSRIRDDPPAVANMARAMLDTLAPLLGVDRPLAVRLLIYVGALEPNAFTVMTDSVATVAVPVERPADERMMLMTHELTHALNLSLAHLPGGWERSIAQTILSEGLAMRATERVHPGRAETAYIEQRPGWLTESRMHEREILSGIRPFLARRDGETIARFTFGLGTTGTDREAYYVGWRVVGYLIEHGSSLATLAHLREQEIPEVVNRTIGQLLNKTRGTR